MGGSLARQEEEQRGGLGRRCGTLSKGARSVLSPRPPGGRRVGQAPGAACPRPWRHPRSAGSGSLAGQGQARRRELLRRRSTPLQGAQNGPRAGRSRRGGWAGRASLGTSPTPPGTGERGSRGRGRGGRGNAAASLLGTEGKLERSHMSFFKLAQLGERRPGDTQGPARTWRWGCVGPGARTPGCGAVRTPAHPLSARPGPGVPRRQRGKARGGGTASPKPRGAHRGPTRPPPLGRSARGHRRQLPPSAPSPGRGFAARSRAPWTVPPPAPPHPQLGAAPRCLWGRRKRPQSKGSKEEAKEGQGPGACGLAWRWGGH